MTGAINNLASSLAGAPVSSDRAARKKAREETAKSQSRARADDEYRARVDQLEEIDAARKLADADQEEASEDRTEHHVGYDPEGQRRRAGDGDHSSLDLSA